MTNTHYKQGYFMKAFTTKTKNPLLVLIAKHSYNRGVRAAAKASILQAYALHYPINTEYSGSAQASDEANELYRSVLIEAKAVDTRTFPTR